MKHCFPFGALVLGAALFTAPLAASAQMTIAQARAAGVGATVSVRGVVLNGPELGPIRYIQDANAGLAVYSTIAALASTIPGDSVLVSGTLKNYNGLLEMDPVTSVTLLAQNRTQVAVPFAAGGGSGAYAEAYEGRLVRLNANTQVTTTAGATVSTFAGNTNYQLNGSATLQFRVASGSSGVPGIVGKPAPTGTFDLIGIMSQYVFQGTSASMTGYQLLPRLFSDFVLGNAPNIVSLPVATNITTTSLDLAFQTLNPGTALVEYGLTPTTLTQTAASALTGTQHTVSLTGLLPATVYYVRVSATNAAGTSVARVIPVITESLSSGRIRVTFTNPVDNSYAWPAGNNAVAVTGGLMADTIIAGVINKATQTLDIAIYNWSNTPILNAVIAAKVRGVRVRVISDGTAGNASTGGLAPNGIPEVERNTMMGIMHDKIIIVDAESTNPNAPLVWCGATNWTTGQLGVDRNNALLIQDQALARVYTMEFEEMWGSNTATAGVTKFGPQKTDNTPHYLKIGGRAVESWFSPTDNVNAKLIETIQTAQNDMHFASMVFTRSDLAQAIRNQIQAQGIASCSEGLLNDTVSGPWFTAASAMGNRLRHYTGPGIMHHKYLLVDVAGSDPTTWTGSHNWSNNANNNNDENTLVIHDARITNQYYQEFAKRIQDENAGIVLCQLRLMGLADATAGATRLAATVYPNPTSGRFSIESDQTLRGNVQVELLDANGRRVLSTTVPAAADHSISLDADRLPAGLYHLRVTSAAGTQLGRVSVVK